MVKSNANALLGAAGSLGSGVISGAMGMINQKLADKRNVQFWHQQNDYNHPTKQMERMREAGLNPNMMYGHGSAASSGNSNQQVKTQSPGTPKIENPMEAYQDTQVREATTDNLRYRNTVLVEQAALSAAQTAGQSIKNAHSQTDLNRANELYDTSIDAAKAGLEEITERNRFNKANNPSIEETNKMKAALNKIGMTVNDPMYLRIMSLAGMNPKIIQGAKDIYKYGKKKFDHANDPFPNPHDPKFKKHSEYNEAAKAWYKRHPNAKKY